MEVRGTQPTAESIWSTLIELLEAQENIKITYEFEERRKRSEKGSSVINYTVPHCELS